MVVLPGLFYEELWFSTIHNISKEPQELQRYYCACEFIGKSGVLKYQ